MLTVISSPETMNNDTIVIHHLVATSPMAPSILFDVAARSLGDVALPCHCHCCGCG